MDSLTQLTQNQGHILVQIARQTLMEAFDRPFSPINPDLLVDPVFQSRRGTFVTLTIDGRLRGCIGNLEGSGSILDGIKRNAINAAFQDPRFSALKKDELDKVSIEISILTEPKPLVYQGSKDLIQKLRPDVDGIILKKGWASATFLPQVWEQLPQPEAFLSQLCLKAGLRANSWKKGDLEIMTYQVQYFNEEKK
jgi:AmmeMemoRadiSam system protein A